MVSWMGWVPWMAAAAQGVKQKEEGAAQSLPAASPVLVGHCRGTPGYDRLAGMKVMGWNLRAGHEHCVLRS